MENKTNLRRLGTMLDCSRNAVMNVDSLKKWVDITADMGYNTLLLYTEDTYEIEGHPYFGYMRGRYTKEELKEMDAYAKEKGMELIPCIQTLAHLNAIVRWPQYQPHVDTADILLAGDEAVYELIDAMFATIAECFTSRTINIGMDEAHMIGRGKYYDLHGDTDRSQILIDHVKRVSEIGEKYGFTLWMWSDMYFRLVAGDNYYDSNAPINEEIKKQIPENVKLIYWDYYSQDWKRYDGMLAAHDKIKEDTVFAGGCWCWKGMTPANEFSIRNTKAAFKACRKHGVQDVFLTLWGDDGAECSKFALLPALFYAAEAAKGNTKLSDIKAKFKEKYGISFDSFKLLDLPGTPSYNPEKVGNSEKYLLYNDCFTGLLDSTLSGGEGVQYKACARKLALQKKNEEWGYLFATQHALCEALVLKAELGVRTRAVYTEYMKCLQAADETGTVVSVPTENDSEKNKRSALTALVADYKKVEKKLEQYYQAYREQWYKENKPYGFDVQDIRLGGLMRRVKNCRERLELLQAGKITVIEELEEKQLDILGGGEEFGRTHTDYWQGWGRIVTTNVLVWQ